MPDILEHLASLVSHVKAAESVAHCERARFHALIRKAHRDGHKQASIARAVGLTRQRVGQIIGREDR